MMALASVFNLMLYAGATISTECAWASLWGGQFCGLYRCGPGEITPIGKEHKSGAFDAACRGQVLMTGFFVLYLNLFASGILPMDHSMAPGTAACRLAELGQCRSHISATPSASWARRRIPGSPCPRGPVSACWICAPSSHRLLRPSASSMSASTPSNHLAVVRMMGRTNSRGQPAPAFCWRSGTLGM
eukprot:CAMPEP_0177311140 /NCGR_PEP_ID=MMETSP0368-20130122/10200_1 /TAXON_ID=447022 ORGANISM="Scrippsiella hangoei-like, Strain SHHI-4" /NCGR_SAMPLE_ID=MMETSP0368 /ASSEMBLY_ACC=CAM_ASM_000363 /LENGTH=187 /DNA_ID=CAMNT_0018770119 /DNA_START=446 /DNA_END=1007 /DNA_ORIENTATION=-